MKTARIVSGENRRLVVNFQERDQDYRLVIESGKNEVGVLFRLCAVLYVNDCDIKTARIHTPRDSFIRDEFDFFSPNNLTEDDFGEMAKDLETLLFDGLSVLEYMGQKNAREVNFDGQGKGEVICRFEKNHPVIEITTADKKGLLLALTQAFYLMEIDVFEAEIITRSDGMVSNTFQINPADKRFQNEEFCRRLGDELHQLF